MVPSSASPRPRVPAPLVLTPQHTITLYLLVVQTLLRLLPSQIQMDPQIANDAENALATELGRLANETSSSSLPLVQPLPFAFINLSGCHINCHTITSLCNWLKSGTLLFSLNLSNNQIDKRGMQELARALNDPCFAHLKRLDIRHNWHDGIKLMTSALSVMKYQCADGNSYKAPFFRIGSVCKRCGVRKAKHTTTRVVENLEELSFSVCNNTVHQDITALSHFSGSSPIVGEGQSG